jgi:hypothetical protein
MARHVLPGAGLAIDHCKEHGTWFDRGELRTVSFLADGERVEALPFEGPGKPGSGWGAAAAGTAGVLDLVFALVRFLPF